MLPFFYHKIDPFGKIDEMHSGIVTGASHLYENDNKVFA